VKTVTLLKQEFESSSSETPPFREFYFAFKADMNRLLKPYIKDIEFHKGHFFVSGFFTLLDNQIYYFNVGDVRWFKNKMLIRTAKHYEDYDGGSNGYVYLDKDFGAQLLKYLRVDELAKQTCSGQTALA
jgi:hypothetical protein